MTRTRRNWTPAEDAALRRAVRKAVAQSRPLLWRELAKSVPGRTNKDCRRRWWNSLSAETAKGPWSEEEDVRLTEAVRKYGLMWTHVAQAVMTRNADQCSSHWSQVLDPAINHCDWTPAEDAQLLHEVLTHGTNWATIATTHVPRRTTLGLKNRYSTLRLWNQNHNERLERKPDEGETITVLPSPGAVSVELEDQDEYDDDDDGDDDDEYDGEGTDSGLSGLNEERPSSDPGNVTSGREYDGNISDDSGAATMPLEEIWDDHFDQPTVPTPVPLQPSPRNITSTCTPMTNGSIHVPSRTWDLETTMLSLAYPAPPRFLELAEPPKDYAQFHHNVMGNIPPASHPYQPDRPLNMIEVDTAASSKPTAPTSQYSPTKTFCNLRQHPLPVDRILSPPLTATTSSSPDNDSASFTPSTPSQTTNNSTTSTTSTTPYQVTLDIVCTLGQVEAVMASLEREVGATASIKISPIHA